MDIQSVKSLPKRERRTCRANVRLFPSQMKFIEDNELSITRIIDVALGELGHVMPDPGDVDKIARMYGLTKSRGRGRGGKGNIRKQRKSARHRGKR